MSFARSLSNKCGKKILDTATKTGLDAAKTPSKKVIYKTNEATGGELIGKKIAEKIVTPDPVPGVNSRNVEEISIPPEERRKISKKLRQVL